MSHKCTTGGVGVGTEDAQKAERGWEKWHSTYDILADNAPVSLAAPGSGVRLAGSGD